MYHPVTLGDETAAMATGAGGKTAERRRYCQDFDCQTFLKQLFVIGLFSFLVWAIIVYIRYLGARGADGSMGLRGPNGQSCWDTIANLQCDVASEDLNNNSICDAGDCRVHGYACWDLNNDYNCDKIEDTNGDGVCNAFDCDLSNNMTHYLPADLHVTAGGTRICSLVGVLNTSQNASNSPRISFHTLTGDVMLGYGTTETFRATGAGFIGINDTAPSHMLTLNGQLPYLSHKLINGNFPWVLGPTGDTFRISTSASLATAVLALDGVKSYVGIGGILAPTSLLHVSGTQAVASGSLTAHAGVNLSPAITPQGGSAVGSVPGIYVGPTFSTAGAGIGTASAFYIDTFNVGAGTNWGLFVKLPTGGTVTNGAAYFEGSVGLADTAPASLLSMGGTAPIIKQKITSASIGWFQGPSNSAEFAFDTSSAFTTPIIRMNATSRGVAIGATASTVDRLFELTGSMTLTSASRSAVVFSPNVTVPDATLSYNAIAVTPTINVFPTGSFGSFGVSVAPTYNNPNGTFARLYVLPVSTTSVTPSGYTTTITAIVLVYPQTVAITNADATAGTYVSDLRGITVPNLVSATPNGGFINITNKFGIQVLSQTAVNQNVTNQYAAQFAQPSGALVDNFAVDITGTDARMRFNAASSNHLIYRAVGAAAPSTTTRSAGTKIVLSDALSSTLVDYAEGIESNALWVSIPDATSTYAFKWYGGTTERMRLTGDGKLGLGVTPTSFLHITGTLAVSTNTVAAQAGVTFNTAVNPTGTVTTVSTVYTKGSFSVSGGAITNAVGHYIDTFSVAATNNYGLYVLAPTSGTGQNVAGYFGGVVGIQNTAPSALFQISGSLPSTLYTVMSVNPLVPAVDTTTYNHVFFGGTYTTFTSGGGLQHILANPSVTLASGTTTRIESYRTSPAITVSASTTSTLSGFRTFVSTSASITLNAGSSLTITEVVQYDAGSLFTTVTGGVFGTSATVNNMYGFLSRTQFVGVGLKITTFWGVYVDTQTHVNITNFYAGFFNGRVSIGGVTPTSMLHITGTIAGSTDSDAAQAGNNFATTVNPSGAISSGIVSGLRVGLSVSPSSGTTTWATSFYAAAATTSSGTITNCASVYAKEPTAGTNKYAVVSEGHVFLNVVAKTLIYKSGTNACAGSATLSSGTVTVSTTCAAGSSELVFATLATVGGTTGTHYRTTTASGSVTITAVGTTGSTVTTDTSVVNWWLIKTG